MPRASSRNPFIARGLRKFGPGHNANRKKFFLKGKPARKPVAKKVVAQPAPKVKDFQGGKRTVLRKAPREYSNIPKRPANLKRPTPLRAKLRSSITPGTVLILVAGRFRGNRVVFLRQLGSGLLLVTGPYKINGIPLRRVNQAFVVATTTKVDISSVKVDKKFNDAYFRKPVAPKKPKSEAEFFAKKDEKKEKKKIDPARAEDQKSVDSQLLPLVKKVPHLESYLAAKFTLHKRDFPHNMKF